MYVLESNNGELSYVVAGLASYGVNVNKNDYFYGCGSVQIDSS